MNRVRLLIVAMLTAVMAFTIVTPANAAGGGRYSSNHPDSNYTVNFRSNGRPPITGPSGETLPAIPTKEQWTPPGRNAEGLVRVTNVWSPKGGYMQCDGDRYRLTLPKEKWTPACPAEERMSVVVK